MKILITIGWPLHHGGHLSSTLCLGKNLIDQGDTVTLLAPTGPMENEFTQQGIRIFKCQLFTHKLPFNLLAVPRIIWTALKEKFDIIHAMDYQSLYPSFIAATIIGKPFIYTKAGGTVPSFRIPPCEAVIVFSEELLNGMQEIYTDTAKDLLLNKARIDTELYFPSPIIPKSTKGFFIFMAMRLVEGKRPWLLTALEGIKQLMNENINFCFLLAGDGPLHNEMEEQMHEINSLQGKGTIRLLGAITSPEKMRRYYNNASVVIGHGRGILEAMACQKPVICLGSQGGATLVEPKTVKAISEYNFSGRHLKYYPELSDHFTAIIKPLARHPSKAKALAIFAKRYIDEEYSAKIGVQQLSRTYNSAITCFSKKRTMNRLSWIGSEIITRLKDSFTNA